MPPACISFPFLRVSTPLQLPFSLSFSKKAPHYVTSRFLCASLSLCVRRRERSRVGVDLPKSVWTHALPHTHNHTHSQCAKAEIDNTAVNHWRPRNSHSRHHQTHVAEFRETLLVLSVKTQTNSRDWQRNTGNTESGRQEVYNMKAAVKRKAMFDNSSTTNNTNNSNTITK